MQQKFLFGLTIIACLAAKPLLAVETISLVEQWRFALDRNDVGIQENWFTKILPDKIKLPGSLPEQGIGDPITTNTVWTGGIVDRTFFTAPEFEKYRQPGNVKVPFWLQPETYYVGAAWFQREIEVPKNWQAKRVVLSLERPHWETRVWVDGKIIGKNDSLSTPHEYDLGRLAPGKHTLTLRVDNRRIVDVGENSHSISDHTQGNWNGIVGDLSLRGTPLVWLEDLQVYPHVATRSVTVTGRVGNATGATGNGEIYFQVNNKSAETIAVSWTTNSARFTTELPLGESAILWDEFHPVLQHLTAKLGDDQHTFHFGLREIATQGTQFTINGQKLFFVAL